MNDLQPETESSSGEMEVSLFTPEAASSVITSISDTVDPVPNVPPSDAEKASGVTKVEVANVTADPLRSRPEFKRLLSPNFMSAIVRLLHSPEGDSTQVVVETYFGNPTTEGSHTSERHQKVYEFDSMGVVTGGYQQTVKEHWHEPSKNPSGTGVNETLVGNPIVGDALNDEAATLGSDINICASAGI